MRKSVLFGSFILPLLFALACSGDEALEKDDDNNGETEEIEVPDEFETNSKDITLSNSIGIDFGSNGTVTVTNPYTSSVSITETNGNVVIQSAIADTELNYILSGQTTSGSVKIYSDYKFALVLNGVSIVSTSGPAVNIQSGKKVTVSVIAGTNNRLADSSTYPSDDSEDMKAALFSEGQLVFSGTGALQVIGQYKHGICSDDYVRIDEGDITVTCGAKDGIHMNDYFEMNGGTLAITSLGDGIDCEEGYIDITGGSLTVTAKGKGAKGIKSQGNLNISGGTLDITTTGDAYYDSDDADISSPSGIKADGDMTVSGSSELTITSTGAAGKGISVDGSLTFNGGTTSVTTSGDQYVYDSDNDSAAKAIKADGILTVNDGTITIRTSRTEAEGLESKAELYIHGGTVDIESYDDAINATNHIEITGGVVYAFSSTNDGIDSNGTITVSGGTVIAIGSTTPEGGFDCDNSTFKVTGGTLIGLGGSNSTPSSSVSTQRSVLYGGGSYEIVHIESSEAGTGVLTFKLPQKFSQTNLLFSSPSLVANTSYTIYTGGSISGGTSAYGLYTSATYTKGTSAATFTTSSVVTSVGTGNNQNPGGGGGR